MTATATEPPRATRSEAARKKAEERVQLLLAKTGLLRTDLRDLWGETNPQQATQVQKCLGWEHEVTALLQLIRDGLRTTAALGAAPGDAA